MNTFVEFNPDDLVTRDLVEPTAGAAKSEFRKKQAKEKRIIFKSIKDGMMPLLQPLATAKECMDALSRLFDTDAPSLKRTLKKQLHTIKMNKNETVSPFFSRISQLKEQLIAIGALTEEDDFVGVAIDGLPDSWSSFISSVCGRGQSPSFEGFWHDCIEEESRLQRRLGSSSKVGEKDLVLSAKFKKGKKSRGKKPQKDSNLSHIRCFRCDQLGHYAKDCKKFPSQGKRGGKSKRKKLHNFVAVQEVAEEDQPHKRMMRSTTKEEEKKVCYI